MPGANHGAVHMATAQALALRRAAHLYGSVNLLAGAGRIQ